MAYRYFPDGNGDTIKLWDDDGRMHFIPRPHYNTFTNMTSRPDDVLICSYLKSGTHWVWDATNMLLTGNKELTSLDMFKYNHFNTSEPDDVEKAPSPRVLTTHRQFQYLPSDFIMKKRKLILVMRDPRDVCVSLYHWNYEIKAMEYNGTFDGFLTLFLQGKVDFNSWSRWLLSFEKGLKEHPAIPYNVIHYERLKQDPVKEFGKLAEFLEVRDEALVTAVAQQTDFHHMKHVKTQGPDLYGGTFKSGKCNEILYRKGESGGWKDYFTEQQEEEFMSTICQQLGRSDITPLL